MLTEVAQEGTLLSTNVILMWVIIHMDTWQTSDSAYAGSVLEKMTFDIDITSMWPFTYTYLNMCFHINSQIKSYGTHDVCIWCLTCVGI